MTPKEKAKELVEKYFYLFSVELENTIDYREAKQCALIAVDEIIKYSPNKPLEEYDPIQYFKEVKREIKKL